MKRGLHWQILIGLIFGVTFGITFPTNYKITDSTISHLEKNNFDGEFIHILQNEKREFAETETEFLKRIKPSLGPEFYEKHKSTIISESKYNPYLSYISWFGEIFLRALKMIIFPLVLTSVIAGIANFSEDHNLVKLSIKTILYFVTTSSLAIFTGLIVVNIMQPGIGVDVSSSQPIQGLTEEISFKDTYMNIIPTNIFESLATGNMLSIIFFSVLFGYFITRINDRNRILLSHFFNAVNDVLTKLAYFIIRFTPIGIFSLTASFVADQSVVRLGPVWPQHCNRMFGVAKIGYKAATQNIESKVCLNQRQAQQKNVPSSTTLAVVISSVTDGHSPQLFRECTASAAPSCSS